MVRTTTALGLLAAIAPGLACQNPAPTAPPTARIAQLLDDLSEPRRASRAAFELARLGERCVPQLLSALDDPVMRPRVLPIFGRIGAAAAPAVPRLLTTAATAPPQEVPALLQTIADVAPICGQSPRQIFQPLSTAVAAAQDAAEQADLGELRTQIRWEWKRVVERCATAANTPTPTLIEALTDASGFRREAAIYLLGRRGAAATEALGPLLEVLAAEHPSVTFWPESPAFGTDVDFTEAIRDSAATAIVRIAPDAAESLPAHIRRIRNPDEEIRRHSIMAVGARGAGAHAAVQELVAALGDPCASVAGEAATALAMIGPAASVAIPALTASLEHPDPQVGAKARAALRQIQNH